MFLHTIEINDESLVTDIVAKDYRTSGVFRKYGIEYCCGGRVPLKMACEMRGLDKDLVKKELNESTRNIQLTNAIDFNSWDIDFLIDYVSNVHHVYLYKNLPEIDEVLERFTESHKKKYNWLTDLLNSFKNLKKVLLPHLEHEEQVIFPYMRQIAHAHENREPYASLMVRTLRKPVEDIMNQEHEYVGTYIRQCRELTHNYTPSPDACISYKVCFSKLHELDNDMVQHSHLENNILFPKVIAMEKELLRGE
jgi:regulator of cell morphogenesis and NO signaling